MPNWSGEIFIIKKIKSTVPWTYVINDLNGEEIIGTFYKNELQKTDIKNITHVDTSSFALKTNVANLKSEVDKLDNDKLATVPVDLSKTSNVQKMMLLKRLIIIISY